MDKLDLPPKRRTRTSRKAAGPTMVAVAEAAKVSIFTVSAVLNGTSVVSDELRKRVEAAIEITGYKPNSVARSLKTGRTQTIGVVIGDITKARKSAGTMNLWVIGSGVTAVRKITSPDGMSIARGASLT